MTGEEALKLLLEGNRRFVDGNLQHPRQTIQRRAEVLEEDQLPIAAILSCSDSRLPPEIIFDCGLGDLFMVRLAGNATDETSLACLEFAIERLQVPLVLVLGHQQCGAFKLLLEGEAVHGSKKCFNDLLGPAIDAARTQPGDLLDNSIRQNVKRQVERLRAIFAANGQQSPTVVGGYYNLQTGVVEIIAR